MNKSWSRLYQAQLMFDNHSSLTSHSQDENEDDRTHFSPSLLCCSGGIKVSHSHSQKIRSIPPFIMLTHLPLKTLQLLHHYQLLHHIHHLHLHLPHLVLRFPQILSNTSGYMNQYAFPAFFSSLSLLVSTFLSLSTTQLFQFFQLQIQPEMPPTSATKGPLTEASVHDYWQDLL